MSAERRSYFRRGTDHDTGIDLELLTLLRETFQNSFESSITLLERQEVLNGKMEKLLNEINSLCARQATMAAALDKLPGDMRSHSQTQRADEAKEHAGLKLQLYGAFGVLGALVIALISLLVKIWPHIPNTLHWP
jgi:hypothetical protein